jgi:restriction endonuclease S subunit
MNDFFRLFDIAKIRLGHPFRGTIEPEPDGPVHVVQVRDTRVTGEIVQDEMIRTILPTKKEPDWLQEGDILFVAKGSKHYAVTVKDMPEHSVCSPHFYLIRLSDKAKQCFLPEFVAWQLNQQLAQKYFKSTAEGSLHLSVRKQILESAPIREVAFEKQVQIVALNNAAIKEEKVLLQLIENRKAQLESIAYQELEASKSAKVQD